MEEHKWGAERVETEQEPREQEVGPAVDGEVTCSRPVAAA